MKTGQSDFSSSVQVHSGRAGTWCKDQGVIRTIHTACRLINTNGLNYRTICWTKLCTVVKQVLGQLKYLCLSEIWKIKVHHRVGYWSKNFRTAFGRRRTRQKAIRENLWTSSDSSRPKLNLARLSVSECWIGWERSEVGQSIPYGGHGSRLSSITGVCWSLQWIARAVRSGWSDETVRMVWSARSNGKLWSAWMEWSDGLSQAARLTWSDMKTLFWSSWLTRTPSWAVSMIRAGRCLIWVTSVDIP